MLRNRRPHHATVVAYLALFVALGGSSYAAITLSRGSVKGKHIAKNAVTGPKVKNGSLGARDFAAGQLPKGDKGDPGPQGPPGEPGRPGPPGEPNPNAADSELLDGLDSSDFLRSDGTAVNADQLDGRDSERFMQGNGRAFSGAVAIPENTANAEFLFIPGPGFHFDLRYTCPASPSTTQGTLRFVSNWFSGINLFYDDGGANPGHTVVPSGGTFDIPTTAGLDWINLHIQGFPPGFDAATVSVASQHRASDCHVQSQLIQAGTPSEAS